MGAGAKSLFQVFSAHAEVVHTTAANPAAESGILRARGGSSLQLFMLR